MSLFSERDGKANHEAVSSVVGEMLMIALVLILISVFSSSLWMFLPVERYPSVTIAVTNDTTGNITFWHKGGDWIPIADLKVRVGNGNRNDNHSRL